MICITHASVYKSLAVNELNVKQTPSSVKISSKKFSQSTLFSYQSQRTRESLKLGAICNKKLMKNLKTKPQIIRVRDIHLA